MIARRGRPRDERPDFGEAMGTDDSDAERARAVAMPLALVEPRTIDWLWEGWLPRGCIVTVAGEPGAGKSYLLAAVATAVTLGNPLPGDAGRRRPENVLLVASEDDEAAVLRPRFGELGADLDRLWVRTEVLEPRGESRPLVLPDDGQLLIDLAAEVAPALVIIDPLIDVENPGIDTWRQAGQRAVFAPLRRLASTLNCAVVVVRHTRKGGLPGDNPNHRIAGSMDAAASARVVWLVGADPARPDRRGVAVSKTNLGQRPTPRAFSIDAGRFGWDPDAAPDLQPEALFGPAATPEDRTALAAAMDYLRETLRDGPVAVRDVYRGARDAACGERTLDAAKAKLCIRSRKDPGKGGKWMWSLPDGKGAKEPTTDTVCTLAPLPQTPETTGTSSKGARVQSPRAKDGLHPYPNGRVAIGPERLLLGDSDPPGAAQP